MGEYAEYKGREVKIGTCENMTGLTAAQAPLVTKVPNSLDPIACAESIRFRFPFPDEDGNKPGQPEDYRAEVIPGTTVPEDVRHYEWHGPCDKAQVAITQQKVVDGLLALVCECSNCGARYRLPELADAEDVLTAIYAHALRPDTLPEHAAWWTTVALRITDGYLDPPAWVAARASVAA